MGGDERLIYSCFFTVLLNLVSVFSGDIRLTPFYNVKDCMAKVKGYVDELNKGKYYCC